MSQFPQDATLFIDTGFCHVPYHGETACGDVVKLKRIPGEQRLLAVLADGMGHGMRANVLAQLTSTMALRFSAADYETVRSAEIIMDALPVSRDTRISYSTFTIVDSRLGGLTRIVEMGNPDFLLFRSGYPESVPSKSVASPKYQDRVMKLSTFQARPNDRIVLFSDGVTQAGLGSSRFPRGWEPESIGDYIRGLLYANKDISAQELAEKVVREAVAHEDMLRPKDDITCLCLSFRKPRTIMLFTGPPSDRTQDAELARLFRDFDGPKIICGGTTAEILARELHAKLELDPASVDTGLPPASFLSGAALVTEGIYTLSRAAAYLEREEHNKLDPAGDIVRLLLRHDIIELVVGTKINEAYQAPNLPPELELRRSLMTRLQNILRDRYTKEVRLRYI